MKSPVLKSLTCLVVLLGMMLHAGSVFAAAGRDYGESIRALQKGDWEKAEEKIRSALSDEANALESILISGSTRYPYLPYYVLGAALQGQGDCQQAMEAWNESLRQGQVQKSSKEFQSLQAGMTACGGQVAQAAPEPTTEAAPEDAPAPAPEPTSPSPQELLAAEVNQRAAEVQQSLTDLENAITGYARLSRDPYLSAEWSRDWKSTQDTAEQELQRLRQDAERARGGQDVDRLKAIAAEIQPVYRSVSSRRIEAGERIDALEKQRVAQAAERERERERQEALDEKRRLAALQEREEAERRRQEIEASERLAVAKSQLRQELNSAAVPLRQRAGNERVLQARRALSSASVAGETLISSDSTADINKQVQAIRDGLRRYNQAFQEWEAQQRDIALRTPPAALKNIAEAYFAGDYEETVRLARPSQFPDQRQVIQAYLFRSAARYNLYWLTGAKDEELRQNAQKDVAEIKRLNRDFVPYVAAFSPKFLEFFDETDS